MSFSHSKDDKAYPDLENAYSSSAESLQQGQVVTEDLDRKLSVRIVNLITIGGVIGSGLLLGTSQALANSGPVSLVLNFIIMGISVYVTMISLGEMASFIPVAGLFTSYARRFGSESLGFAILSNYWFNDALSVASDLTAMSLVLEYWNSNFHYYIVSIIVWVALLIFNLLPVRLYGEIEYWLAILKVVTIFIFFIISIVVNAGVNPQHVYIGFSNYHDTPFVDGFKGFAKVFVTSAFTYGGLESITLTAGETKNPTRNIPKTIKLVFIRILIFYVLTTFFIGLNIPVNYPGLLTKSVQTSPFTISFHMVGAKAAGSFMNAVVLTSLISAGNHALYAGSRLGYTLGTERYLPKFLTKTNRWKVPYISTIITWFIGGLCFGASFVGAGTLWTWLQCIVGVSNQFSWWTIAIISIRFRRGLAKQGKTHLLNYVNWTYPYGPWLNLIFISFIILVQGWSAFAPWDVTSFFQSYLEVGVFPLSFIIWYIVYYFKNGKFDKFMKYEEMDFETDRYIQTQEEIDQDVYEQSLSGWKKFRYNFVDNFL